MSHVDTIRCEINDLDALKAACKHLGLDFREGQTRYKWYGAHVGDYKLPEGRTREQMGTCLHAIGVPGNSRAYEVGVVPRAGSKGYGLEWDFWSGGHGLQAAIGDGGQKLTQRYAAEAAKAAARRKGMRVTETVKSDGTIKLTLQAR